MRAKLITIFGGNLRNLDIYICLFICKSDIKSDIAVHENGILCKYMHTYIYIYILNVNKFVPILMGICMHVYIDAYTHVHKYDNN